VAASFMFVPGDNRPVITIFIGLAVIYNIVLSLGNRLMSTFLVDRPSMLVIDTMFSITLVVFSGGVASPYIAILPLMIISSAYWYGSLMAIVVGLIQIGVIVVDYLISNDTQHLPRSFLIQMPIFITIGLYVSWLSKSERSERNELLALATEIESEKKQLLTLINNIGDSIFVLDNKGKVVVYNDSATKLIGKQNILKKPIKDLLDFQNKDKEKVNFDIKQLSSLPESTDLKLKAPDTSLMDVSISASQYTVERQNKGYVLIIRDITKEKSIEEERKDFIAVAAHELRTPLTIAQGDVSFLLSPPFLPENPESVHILNGALRSLKQLSHIISDLTNLAAADSQNLDVKLEPLDCSKLLKDLQTDFKDQASEKGIVLITKIERKTEIPIIYSSRYIVQEILSALINNAIKFSDKGLVTLSIVDNEENEDGVTFAVKDNGIGISQSDQKKIFQKFFQSEDFMTRSHGGTGLGLYIANKLANRLTAKVSFKSNYGKGSTFFLWVPSYSKDKNDLGEVAKAEAKELLKSL